MLILLSPLLAVISILIKYRLGSPVFFRQKRPGFLGRPFWLLKFRTMTNKLDDSGKLLPDRERLTPFGSWLRSTSIDELPSLINIARGEMSFVGPRPFVIPFEDYDEKFLPRFDHLPGLTGWAQVNGRNSIPWEKKFELDCHYVSHVSLKIDLFILVKTIFVLFDKRCVNAEGHATFPDYGA